MPVASWGRWWLLGWVVKAVCTVIKRSRMIILHKKIPFEDKYPVESKLELTASTKSVMYSKLQLESVFRIYSYSVIELQVGFAVDIETMMGNIIIQSFRVHDLIQREEIMNYSFYWKTVEQVDRERKEHENAYKAMKASKMLGLLKKVIGGA